MYKMSCFYLFAVIVSTVPTISNAGGLTSRPLPAVSFPEGRYYCAWYDNAPDSGVINKDQLPVDCHDREFFFAGERKGSYLFKVQDVSIPLDSRLDSCGVPDWGVYEFGMSLRDPYLRRDGSTVWERTNLKEGITCNLSVIKNGAVLEYTDCTDAPLVVGTCWAY